jgi:hypothetical protein
MRHSLVYNQSTAKVAIGRGETTIVKLIAIPLFAFVVTFIGLLGLMIIFNAITEPNYEPCATEADAGRQFANTGVIRKNSAGQYLCVVNWNRK